MSQLTYFHTENQGISVVGIPLMCRRASGRIFNYCISEHSIQHPPNVNSEFFVLMNGPRRKGNVGGLKKVEKNCCCGRTSNTFISGGVTS